MNLSGLQILELQFWHWWVIALFLVVGEALSPYGFFAGMAITASLMGVAALVFPELGWQAQLALFAAGTALFTFVWRLIFKIKHNEAEDVATLQRARECLGEEFVLKLPVQNGFGEAEVNGINWELKGPDMKAGTTVKVVALDGMILSVIPIKKPDTPAQG